MKQKLIAIILALALALSLPGTALAAEEARQTDFFAGVPHSQTDFADMEYKHIEPDSILALIEEARGLMDDPANAERVAELYGRIFDGYLELRTMATLAYILADQDIWDEEAAAESLWCRERNVLIADALMALLRDILNSPCAAFLEERLDPDSAELLRQYEDMTDRVRELYSQETALKGEYETLAAQTFTAVYDGREWDPDSLEAALADGAVDQETYDAIKSAIAAAKNEILGEFYLELTAARRELAEASGYDSYASYAYENLYDRDYTPEEIRSFHAAVKEYIAPLAGDLTELRKAYRQVDEYKALLTADYIGDTSLDMMEPYVGQLSSELLESFEYLRRCHLYDMDHSDAKAGGSYTVALLDYGAGFIFISPYGDIRDFQTAIHEFGHYNKDYHTGWSWERSAMIDNLDAAEVHSQGLEALFLHFYPEIFGGLATVAEIYEMEQLVYALIEGALHDEFQQYVYAADGGLTLEMLNEKYHELCAEYGLLGEDGELLTFDWVDIPHTFNSPCYYISYATSAAGALAVWEESQSDFYGAVDKYLAFTALEPPMGFVERFAAVGMENPIDPAFIKTLSETLSERLDLEGRREELSRAGETISRAALAQMLYDQAGETTPVEGGTFADVAPEASYAEAVAWAAEKEYILGYGDGTFGPDDPVTREQAAVILYRHAGGAEADGDLSDFADAADVSGWAVEAVAWAADAEILAAGDGARLDPRGETTRVGAAAMLLRATWMET